MNKLNEMEIAALADQEVKDLMEFEKKINQMHNNEEVYCLVLKR